MARDWLVASAGKAFASTDVYNRVQELVQSDLDPGRGWRLVQVLVEIADSDRQLRLIGSEAISPLIANHSELVDGELATLARGDVKFRRAIQDQMSVELFEFKKRHGLSTKV